jgi:hypothetical protein
MDSKPIKPNPGDPVVLVEAPPELLLGLPREDQEAISGAIGNTVLFVGYDDDGKAEIEFTDKDGIIHIIYVNPTAIKPTQ